MSPAIRIMVVEDEYLLATDLADFLRESGYEVAGPVPSVERALALIEQQHPVAAILDIQLRNECSYPVADRLAALGVPFLFLSGYEPEEMPVSLRDRPLLSKLDGFSAIRQELETLLGNAAAG